MLRSKGGTWLVFALVALSLLGALLLTFRTVDTEREQRAEARRTARVLVELANVHRAVLNAETGQRGYLITLDRRYLEPYTVARDQYRSALARVRTLMADGASPQQRALMDRIETLTHARFGELADSVTLIERGDLLEARSRVLSDEGQAVMVRLRAAFRELEAIETEQLTAATADAATAEGRIIPLLSALFALVLLALAFAYRLVGRTARAEAEAAQAEVSAEARDRADLLARELNHRVKNLFAVILAIVRLSAKDAPESHGVIDRIADRIPALLTAHQVTQGAGHQGRASLQALLETSVKPYLSSVRRAELEGPAVELPERNVTPLGLVLHELATNAVKYGCWATGGLLRVTWQVTGDELAIDWREDVAHSGEPPAREGFGSQLMTSAARQLGGSIDRRFSANGVHVAIRFPLAGG